MKSGKAIVFLLGITVALVVTFQNCSKQSVDFGIADSTKPGPNDCEFGTSFVRNGQSVTSYLVSSVNPGQTCISEDRYCDQGRLSGSFAYTQCQVGVPKSCVIDKKEVPHGSSVIAYKYDKVNYGSSCDISKTTRICNDGTLSGEGDYIYTTCVVSDQTQPKDCTVDNINYKHLSSSLFYSTATVVAPNNCIGKIRSCNDGVMSGDSSYSFSNCSASTIALPKDCTINNINYKHSTTNIFYSSESVTSPNTCLAQNRVCNDGVMSGDSKYLYKTCTVTSAPMAKDCVLGKELVKNLTSKAFYLDSAVTYPSKCQSQVRTCNEGLLSGSYASSTCEVIKTDLFDYKVQANSKPLDVIITIDSSGNMLNSTAHVRKNIINFINKIYSSNTRVGIITSKEHISIGLGIDLNSYPDLLQLMGNNLQQAEQFVHVFSNLNCLIQKTKGTQPYSEYLTDTNSRELMLCENNGFHNYKSTNFTNDFLRTNSHKIIVSISNSNSMLDSSIYGGLFGKTEAFYSSLNPEYFVPPTKLNMNFTVFGFVGLGSTSPCQDRTGEYYKKLAYETGGEVFNICDLDWTGHFDKLIETIKFINTSSIELGVLPSEIIEVKINNTLVSVDKYKIFGKFIRFDVQKLNLVAGNVYTVEVKYKLKNSL